MVVCFVSADLRQFCIISVSGCANACYKTK